MSVANDPRTFKRPAALLDQALAYARRGWSIIPTIGKKPAGLWRPFQDHPADETTLRRLFAKKGVTGLAAVTGRVSGGLAVRDFDDADAYHAWATANPGYATSLPTAKTARGFHVYGCLDFEAFTKFDNGELRADSGHYILLPPSFHPDGSIYQWLTPLPAESSPLPALPHTLRLQQIEVGEEETQEQPKADPADPTNSLASLLVSHDVGHPRIQQAVDRTLPSGPRQRRQCLFNLARILKSLIPNAKPAEIRIIVQRWHRIALPFIRTKEFSASWIDFISAWNCVKQPAGLSFRAAADAVNSGAVPPSCACLGYDGDLRRLTALCWQLQLQWGNHPFPLGCRTAGEFLGVSKTEAHRMLGTLQFDGILRLVRKGTKKNNKASEWLYREQS